MEIGSKEWKAIIIEGAREFGITVHPHQADLFARHAAVLIRWNQKMNLTSIVSPIDMAVRHYLDSVIPIPYIKPYASLLDVGSGAGFPGIPLKIMLPSMQVTLLEAKRKKVSFLRHIIQVLNLKNMLAEQARFEALAHDPIYRETFDVVIGRAFSNLEHLVHGALPLLSTGGVIVAPKGREVENELQITKVGDCESVGLQVEPKIGGNISLKIVVIKYTLPHFSLPRSLVILEKRCSQ
jgi:16S rRNA (guanine527-N7)-methyltransferase